MDITEPSEVMRPWSCPSYLQKPVFLSWKTVLKLDGESNIETDKVIIPTSEDYTVECWAYAPASALGEFRHLVAPRPSVFILALIEGAISEWAIRGSTPEFHIRFGSWNHITVAKRSDRTDLYINGVDVATRDGLLPVPVEVATFRIGRQHGRNRPGLDGTVAWIH